MATELRTTEEAAYRLADELTTDMLRSVMNMVQNVLPGEGRAQDSVLIAGLVQAMATNFAAIANSRK